MYTNYFAMGIKAMFVLDFPRKEQGITGNLCSFTVLGKSWVFFDYSKSPFLGKMSLVLQATVEREFWNL